MPNEIIKFDAETKKLVDNLVISGRQIERQLELLCQVYLNAKGQDSIKNAFQLLPDNSGLMKVEKKESESKGK